MIEREVTDAEATALASLLYEKMKKTRIEKERNSGTQEKLSFAQPIIVYSKPTDNWSPKYPQKFYQQPMPFPNPGKTIEWTEITNDDGTISILQTDGGVFKFDTVKPPSVWKCMTCGALTYNAHCACKEEDEDTLPTPGTTCYGAGCFVTHEGNIVHKMGCPQA